MNASARRRTTADRRDAGFTLPELLIVIVLMALIASVVTMAIITSLRTAPDVTSRADSAIAVQGITTFLPPDVDSTEPNQFDTDPSRGSGCAGTDPGVNIVHMTWHEEFLKTTTTFVANYRFVDEGTYGRIVRLSCSGQFSLGAPRELNMSAEISTTPPTVTLFDRDGDGKDDSLKVAIVTLAGSTVFIDAATKNPAETLPLPTTTPTTTTTTTTAPNQPPVANPTALTANPNVVVTFSLNASDPESNPMSSVIGSVPPGWVVVTSGTTVQLTPVAAAPGVYNLTYTVTDTVGGGSASSTLTVTITTSPTTTTTTTTATTTTTTLPPCVVSQVTAVPSTVELQSNGTGKLKKDVVVTATVTGGYCIGLTLQYNTGGPNGQYVQNLGDAAPYTLTLLGHPQGTELWTTGTKALQVRDSFNNVIGQTNLVVTD